jgi:hypothetical protein
MSVCCECCVLLGRGLCDGLITPPERVLLNMVRSCVRSRHLVNEVAMAHGGCCSKKKNSQYYHHHWRTGSIVDRFTAFLYSCLEQNTWEVTFLPNSPSHHNCIWEKGCIALHILKLCTNVGEWSASKPGLFNAVKWAACTYWIGGRGDGPQSRSGRFGGNGFWNLSGSEPRFRVICDILIVFEACYLRPLEV